LGAVFLLILAVAAVQRLEFSRKPKNKPTASMENSFRSTSAYVKERTHSSLFALICIPSIYL